MGKVRANAAKGVVERDLTPAPRVLFCTKAQRDLLIAKCDREDLKLVLMLGFHAGLRKNEIIQAVPFWFNMEQGFFDLRATPTMPFNTHKRARKVAVARVVWGQTTADMQRLATHLHLRSEANASQQIRRRQQPAELSKDLNDG